ncbi:MAG: Holo-[acyl-carrier-protein] synthase [Chlamydiae bacterium]|nr:Holo-[acyl-carrier-protein] synthase [Chlamydiota bacterium]
MNNQIKGLGNDIIEIDRIRKTIERHGTHFYNKVFTEAELEYCLSQADPATPLAGRFSAKEAIAKALGTGLGKSVSFLDIEILNDDLGRPFPTFTDSFNDFFNTPHILISISHCKEYATAVALWLADTPNET